MTSSASEIKQRLLKVADENTGKVRDMNIALEIIAMLETTEITEGELNETRLGRFINNIRKNSKDEGLKKRLRKLIKTWTHIVKRAPSKPAPPPPTSSVPTSLSSKKKSSNSPVPSVVVNGVSAENNHHVKVKTNHNNNGIRLTLTTNKNSTKKTADSNSTTTNNHYTCKPVVANDDVKNNNSYKTKINKDGSNSRSSSSTKRSNGTNSSAKKIQNSSGDALGNNLGGRESPHGGVASAQRNSSSLFAPRRNDHLPRGAASPRNPRTTRL